MSSSKASIEIMLKVFVLVLSCTIACGTPITYNQPYNNNVRQIRGYLTPPRAITTLNTFVPRRLIPPAPPRPAVPRVYENFKRVYTAPAVFRPIPPAPTTRRSFVNNSNSNTRYAYNYNVNDNRTGDIKTVEERLENGVVTGSYSLTEPDGSIRTVTYTADDVNGFNAVVEKTNQPVNDGNNNSQFRIFT